MLRQPFPWLILAVGLFALVPYLDRRRPAAREPAARRRLHHARQQSQPDDRLCRLHQFRQHRLLRPRRLHLRLSGERRGTGRWWWRRSPAASAVSPLALRVRPRHPAPARRVLRARDHRRQRGGASSSSPISSRGAAPPASICRSTPTSRSAARCRRCGSSIF